MRIRSAGCCDCKTPCLLECRSKAGLAELCGFEEFTDPSDPPKRYRRKTLSGEVTVCTWTRLGGAECTPPVIPEGLEAQDVNIPVLPDMPSPRPMPDPAPAAGETLVAAGESHIRNDNNGGRVFLYAYVYALPQPQLSQGVGRVRLRIHWEYRIQGGGVGSWGGRPLPWIRLTHPPAPPWHTPGISAQLSGLLPNGDTFGVPDAVATGDLFLDWTGTVGGTALFQFDVLHHSNFQGSSYSVTEGGGSFTWPAYVEASSERRVYAGASTYDAATCALSIDSTVAITTSSTGCEPEGEGTPEATPTSVLLRAGAEIEETQTQRTQTADAVCYVNSMGRDVQITADVGETLAEEDTEEDAMARALAGIADWTGGECAFAPAFITQRVAGQTSFAFRATQVRAQLGGPASLMIGHTYLVEISFYSRVLGSGGEWVFSGLQELEVVADEAVEFTPWIDVPQEVGMETVALVCRYQDITPPEEA